MASDSTNTNKRRRAAADTLHISDLPIGLVVEDVLAYLSRPSRAIFAVALSAPSSSSSWQSDDNLMHHRLSPISTAIVSAQQWDTLNFEDIEKELANKLSDDDIYAILKCINAHDVLKRLSLAGCINISGMGLEPLRGSVALEQIDLSRTDKNIDDPAILSYPYPNPRMSVLSEEIVVNLLDSIVNKDGCSLKYILFPQMWRDETFVSSVIGDFRTRYNQMYQNASLSVQNATGPWEMN